MIMKYIYECGPNMLPRGVEIEIEIRTCLYKQVEIEIRVRRHGHCLPPALQEIEPCNLRDEFIQTRDGDFHLCM